MSEAADEPVIRHQVVVPGTPERAFAAFTERFDAIKAREHNVLGSPIVPTTFEPQEGGHIVDRGEDGSECRWARVLLFSPRPAGVQLGHRTDLATGDRPRERQ